MFTLNGTQKKNEKKNTDTSTQTQKHTTNEILIILSKITAKEINNAMLNK